MYVPRKPHPQGNEYHSIACGESGILYSIELVEGKDCPPEKSSGKYMEQHGKTGSLLLRLYLKKFLSEDNQYHLLSYNEENIHPKFRH